jgi:galactokinase
MDTPARLKLSFQSRFGELYAIYRAPGRVNLIGEHTDYNGGYVLPAALDFSCWVAAGTRPDHRLAIYSENMQEFAEADLQDPHLRRAGRWSDYPIGVAWALREAGCPIRGANLYIRGEVPLGAGLSSSAAIEVAVGFALLDLAGQKMEPLKLAQLCQRAENEFVGARCGIMDQFIACHGRAGSAVLLDCRTLKHQNVKLPEELQLVICNSMVKHELAAGEYNKRRSECEEGVRLLGAIRPGVSSLRDVPLKDLEDYKALLPDSVFRRCRHVLTENERTLEMVVALRERDLPQVGKLMFASHASLRDDYEVSCEELDLLVDLARKEPGLIGARMTGGGFGGCTVNLVKKEFVEQFSVKIVTGYEVRAGRRPEVYLSGTANGVERAA